MTRVVSLCDWARCINCGQSRPASDTSIPTCCEVPLVISLRAVVHDEAPEPRPVPDISAPLTRAVLRSLMAAGTKGLNSRELRAVGGGRFGARVQDLRDAGYTIHSQRESQTSWRYTIELAQQEKAA